VNEDEVIVRILEPSAECEPTCGWVTNTMYETRENKIEKADIANMDMNVLSNIRGNDGKQEAKISWRYWWPKYIA
jgi:hypothetical protein